ncbi:MAG: class I SAM-dependent methyltransferase [Parcubacteria group bacterium]|jgi:2-polyprenyl-3-methyl-5-hydroxy-6-metoxy-1,4-benzoquinol methylase
MDIENYSKIAPQYYNNSIPSILKNYLDKFKYESILDCGCGDGSLLYALDKFGYFTGKKVFAIDMSENRIKLVKKINSTIIASVDSAEELKTIENDSIDLFISTQVIEHVDDKKMIKQIENKLSLGGVAYISTVFKKWYGWYYYRNNGKWVIDPTHMREYSRDDQLLSLFDQKKFTLLENKKELQWFPILDFFVKRINLTNRRLYENSAMKLLRKIKLPILGYYHWEIALKKIDN